MANGGLEVVNRSEPEHNRLSDSEKRRPHRNGVLTAS